MSENREKATVKSKYDDLSVEELSARLHMTFFCTEDFTDDALEEVDALTAAYRVKHSEKPVKSTAEAWEEFKTIYLNKEKGNDNLSALAIDGDTEKAAPVQNAHADRRGLRILSRVGLAAAVIAVVLAFATLTAGAFGFNLWGWIARWDDEVAQFEQVDAETAEPKDIPEALKYLGIDEPVYPKWLPEGFVKAESVIQTDEPIYLYENYKKDDQFLFISIEPSSALTESGITQKDGSEPEEYISNQVVHYIFKDTAEYLCAVWYSKNYSIRITGNLSSLELRRIIDSIY